MRHESSNDRRWRVRGLIIGPRLPKGILHVGPCTICPATQDDVEHLYQLAPPEFSISTLSSQGVVIFPIRTQLKSHHIFSFEVAGGNSGSGFIKGGRLPQKDSIRAHTSYERNPIPR